MRYYRRPSRKCSSQLEDAFRLLLGTVDGTMVEPYKGDHKVQDCKCVRGHPVKTHPYAIFQRNLPFCRKCITIDKFFSKVQEFGGVVIGKYMGLQTKIECRCMFDHQTFISPGNLLYYAGRQLCKICSGMSSALANEKFHLAVEHRGGKVVGEYVNTHTKVECICANGHSCTPTPTQLISSESGMCSVCAGRSLEHNKAEFAERVKNKGATLIGEYTTSTTPVDVICAAGHPCKVSPNNIRRYGFCGMCNGHNAKHGLETLMQIFNRLNYTLMSEYKRSQHPITCKCNKGHIFQSTRTHFTAYGGRCTVCYPRYIGQTKIGESLSMIGVEFKAEYGFPNSRRRFDYMLPAYNVIIEFDGMQHFVSGCFHHGANSDLQKAQQVDRDKMLMAFKNGFKIIRFDYTWGQKSVEHIAHVIKRTLATVNDTRQNLWVSCMEKYAWLVSPPTEHET